VRKPTSEIRSLASVVGVDGCRAVVNAYRWHNSLKRRRAVGAAPGYALRTANSGKRSTNYRIIIFAQLDAHNSTAMATASNALRIWTVMAKTPSWMSAAAADTAVIEIQNMQVPLSEIRKIEKAKAPRPRWPTGLSQGCDAI